MSYHTDTSNERPGEEGGGGGGYSLTVAIWVCYAQRGRVLGDSDPERGIIFNPFCRTGCNIANARKLQNIIVILTERGIKNLSIFYNEVSLRLQTLSKTGSTFESPGGTHPPKTYSSSPSPGYVTNYIDRTFFQFHLSDRLDR